MTINSVGPKDLTTPINFILSPRPVPRRKIRPRTNKEGPNCQGTLPRTILSSANQDYGKRKRHATKSRLPERPKGKERTGAMKQSWKYSGGAIPG